MLVDGSNLLFRSFFAFGRSNLTTGDGRPSGAVFGFTRLLLDAITKEKPDEVFVAWDPKGGSFRDKKYTYYKANRPDEMPEDLRAQLPEVFRLLDALGVKQQALEGFEADDLIGTLAAKAEAAGWKALIYSGDRDLFQLVNKDVRVLYPSRKGGLEKYDAAGVRTKMGVGPDLVVDFKGLAGDSSDNIKGVPGVGEKTALKLLAEFGSFEEIFARVDEVAPAGLQTKIRDNERLARDSYWLATVKTDCELDLNWTSPQPFRPHKDELENFIGEYGLKSLQKALPDILAKYGQKISLDTSGVAKQIRPSKTRNKWSGLLADLEEVGRVGLGQIEDKFYLGYEWGREEYFGEVKDVQELLREYRGRVVVFDLKTLMKRFWLENNYVDVTLGLYVWNSSWSGGIDLLLADLGYSSTQEEALAGLKLLWVHDYLVRELEQTRLDLWLNVENPLAVLLAKMELAGIYIDKRKLEELNEVLLRKGQTLTREIYGLFGREDFNLNSTQQLSTALVELGYVLGKKNKNGGYSTSAVILEKLAETDERGLITKILEYRTVTKLTNSFTDSFLKLLDETSRLHTEYGQTVVPTGRLSSKNPNLQNIPIKHPEYGPLIRGCFGAPSPNLLLVADYSQIELRCLAHLSKDPVLIDAFKKGQDIHARTAAEIFEIPLVEVTSHQRRLGKTLNFALVYQQGAFATARQLNISRTEAKEFIGRYFARFARVKPLIENVLEKAREQNYTQTIWGRRRYFHNLKSGNSLIRQAEERAAFNAVLQGSAADIVKLAMLQVEQVIKDRTLDALMLMQVHDELVFEIGAADIDSTTKAIEEAMSLNQPLDVPLRIDIGVGNDWDGAK